MQLLILLKELVQSILLYIPPKYQPSAITYECIVIHLANNYSRTDTGCPTITDSNIIFPSFSI